LPGALGLDDVTDTVEVSVTSLIVAVTT